MTPLRKRMIEELQLRNLSEITTHTYVGMVERYAKYFGAPPERLGAEQVREYLLHLINDHKAAPNTIQVTRAALKFLYVKTLKRPWFEEEVAKMKRPPLLPTVLSVEEITRILDRTTNLKHWTMIATLYATGLRCNERRHLKAGDIDRERMLIHVRHAKGRIPRDIGLSPALLERLRIYWRSCKPQAWLFPSQKCAQRLLDEKSIRVACMNAGRRAGISKQVSPHVFRHSCATHMLEAGTDLRTIQVLLGHADIQTTARYLRVSTAHIQATASPFDSLSLRPIGCAKEDEQRR